ncbi:uncharacterized protein AAGF69_013927 isoform 5-T7 [Amazona ochrocephala]
MRPQEKLLFKSPAAIALQHLASITQVWRFQRAQAELMLASHRHAARRHRAAMEEAKRELSVKESSPLAGEGAAGDPLPMGIYGGLWGTSLPLITPLCPTQEQHPPAHRGHIPGTHSAAGPCRPLPPRRHLPLLRELPPLLPRIHLLHGTATPAFMLPHGMVHVVDSCALAGSYVASQSVQKVLEASTTWTVTAPASRAPPFPWAQARLMPNGCWTAATTRSWSWSLPVPWHAAPSSKPQTVMSARAAASPSTMWGPTAGTVSPAT